MKIELIKNYAFLPALQSESNFCRLHIS